MSLNRLTGGQPPATFVLRRRDKSHGTARPFLPRSRKRELANYFGLIYIRGAAKPLMRGQLTDKKAIGRAILSTRYFSRAESIDGGDTIVLHFLTADGQDTAIMITRRAARTVQEAIGAELAKPTRHNLSDGG